MDTVFHKNGKLYSDPAGKHEIRLSVDILNESLGRKFVSPNQVQTWSNPLRKTMSTGLTDSSLTQIFNKRIPVITEDTIIPEFVLFGVRLNTFSIYNEGGVVTFNIGTTPGGSDLFTGKLEKSEIDTWTMNRFLNTDSPVSIYISSDNWNEGRLHMVIQLESMFKL